MRVDEKPNGSVIVIEERTLLRWGSLATGALLGVILLVLRFAGITKDPVRLLPGAGVSLFVMMLAAVIPERRFAFEPALGRSFSEGDARPGHDDVVLLSDGFWRRQFGADSAAVGRRIVVDGTPCTIVGVLPNGFVR